MQRAQFFDKEHKSKSDQHPMMQGKTEKDEETIFLTSTSCSQDVANVVESLFGFCSNSPSDLGVKNG